MNPGAGIVEKLAFSFNTTVTSVMIVFGILVILMLIIVFQSFVINRVGGSKSNRIEPNEGNREFVRENITPESVKVEEVIDLNSEYELVAAIMAALSTHIGRPVSELNVKSIKRINNVTNWNRQ